MPTAGERCSISFRGCGSNCPPAVALRDLLPDLCNTWKWEKLRFPRGDIDLLEELYLGTRTARVPPKADPLSRPAAPAPVDTFERVRQMYLAKPSPTARTDFFLQIQKRATELLQAHGADSAAELIRGLRAEFPDFAELARLPDRLREKWHRSVDPAEVDRFLVACQRPLPPTAEAPYLRIPLPKAMVPDEVLLGAGRDESGDRMREYLRQTAPGVLTDQLRFSVVAPPLAPGRAQTLVLLAHGPDIASQTLERIAGTPPTGTAADPTARLVVEGVRVDGADQPLLWEGGVGVAHFPVRWVGDTLAGDLTGRATVHVAGLEMVRLDYRLRTAAAEGPAARVLVPDRRHQRAYACHAVADGRLVAALLGRAAAAAPGWGHCTCGDDDRASTDWQRRIKDAILGCDVFYLFWSDAARHSDWVNWDWRCAVAQRDARHIVPVPLDSPEAVPPPAELLQVRPLEEWVLAYEGVRRGLESV